MDNIAIGKAGLKGWRGKVADSVATPVARRSTLSEDQVRATLGALFLALSTVYVVGAVRRIVARS